MTDGNGLFGRSTYFWIVCSAETNGNRSLLLAGRFRISRVFLVRRRNYRSSRASLAILRCGLGGLCCWGTTTTLVLLPTAKSSLTLPQSRSSCSSAAAAARRSVLAISQIIFTSCEENLRAYKLGIRDCLEEGICI